LATAAEGAYFIAVSFIVDRLLVVLFTLELVLVLVLLALFLVAFALCMLSMYIFILRQEKISLTFC